MYSLSKIRQSIRDYNLKKILQSGERDMIDQKLNKDLLNDCFKETEKIEEVVLKIDVNKTLDSAKEKALFDSIINLKDSYVE